MNIEYASRSLKKQHLAEARKALEEEDLLTKARLHKVRLCLEYLSDYMKREEKGNVK